MILRVPVAANDHVQGSKDAAITLIEYGDYQCPYCGAAYPVTKQIQKHFGNQLRFVFRNFPLTEIHPLAAVAAEAAEFAADHNHFWEMHDLIFENQRALSVPTLLELASALRLSPNLLEKALQTRSYEQKIRSDFLGGVKSGVNGTPTFFINDQRYNGSPEFRELVAAIELMLVK